MREALDAAHGTFPESDEPAKEFACPDFTPPREPWLQRLARANWGLVFTIVGSTAAVAGAVMAYLTLVQPH
jgi:hypothetical protein